MEFIDTQALDHGSLHATQMQDELSALLFYKSLFHPPCFFLLDL